MSNFPLAQRVVGSRRNRIATWLRSVPPVDAAASLALCVQTEDGGSGGFLWQWMRTPDYDAGYLASEIDQALQGAADEQGIRVDARLQWLKPRNEGEWTGIALKASPQGAETQMDGTLRSQLIQEQRHKEAFASLQFDAIDRALQTLAGQLEAATRVVNERTDRVGKLEAELAEANRRLLEADARAREAESIAEEATANLEAALAKFEEDKKNGSQDATMLQLVSNVVGMNQKKG